MKQFEPKQKIFDKTKKQILKEFREIGNTDLVAIRHNISKHPDSWVKKPKKQEYLEIFLKMKKRK